MAASRHLRSDEGFALVELLVVVSILVLMVSLLLPALQATRETARRLECASHLRQLGIAIQSYETAFRAYPPPGVTMPRRHNLLTFLLPYLEHQQIYDRYDWLEDWDAEANRAATQVEIPHFRCPASVHEYPYAGDYAACVNLVSPARRTLLTRGLVADRRSWLSMLQRSRSTPGLVSDGLSHSLLLFEDAGRPSRYVEGVRQPGTTSGGAWADSDSSFEIHHLCRGVSLMNCRNDNEIYSFHPGGCEFLFGDGSVQFLSQDIDPETFVSLFTRAAGDIAGQR